MPNTEALLFQNLSTSPDYFVKDGRIIFKDEGAYNSVADSFLNGLEDASLLDSEISPDEYLDNWENEIGFFSFRRSYLTNPNPAGFGDFQDYPIDDVFLMTTLNPNGLVQVGNWIFRMIPETEEVKALHRDNIHLLPHLINPGNDSYPEILNFTYQDEVFEEIEVYGEENKWPCLDPSAAGDSYQTKSEVCPSEGNSFFVKVNLKYNRFGIREKLVLEVKAKHRTSAGDFVGYGNWKVRCRDKHSYTKNASCSFGTPWVSTRKELPENREVEFKPMYHGTRKLEYFYMEVQPFIRDMCSQDFNNGCSQIVSELVTLEDPILIISKPD